MAAKWLSGSGLAKAPAANGEQEGIGMSLRVRELAATKMERSSVKAGMTKEREWDIETGEGR